MALKTLGKLMKVSTKAGLTGGTLYVGYESGLWKGTDETIANYEKLKKDAGGLYTAYPDIQKWAEFVNSSVDANVKPYKQAVSDFRKEWLNFDLSGISHPIDGVVKPAWNKGVAWVAEAIADSPQTLQNLGAKGIKMIQESASPAESGKPASK